MNNTLNKILIFAAGAIIGSAVSWKFAKDKYERIAQEEIDAVKKYYANKLKEASTDKEPPTKPEEEESADPSVSEYNNILQSEGYFSYDEVQDMRKHFGKDHPYVIEPAEYGEFDDYDLLSLTYYADGVLVDSSGEPVDDVDGLIGTEALDRIGEFEPDSIHVRNDKRKADIEILQDLSRYSDIKKPSPHVAEDADDED